MERLICLLAIALISVHVIHTLPLILAWIALTLINLLFTIFTQISIYTRAFISVRGIRTRSSILTWIRATFIDIHLAVDSGISGEAATLEPIQEIDAWPTVETRLGETFLDIWTYFMKSLLLFGKSIICQILMKQNKKTDSDYKLNNFDLNNKNNKFKLST